jgi:hypothetical protein
MYLHLWITQVYKTKTNINQTEHACLTLLQHDTFADKKVRGFVVVLECILSLEHEL